MKGLGRECLAEFFGIAVLLIFGIGSVASVVLSEESKGNYFSINVGWGLGVVLGVYVAGGISGGHLNPAVTIALATRGKFPWPKVGPYILAQVVGALFASAVVYGVYFEALSAFDGGTREITGPKGTAGIWATYPQEYLSNVPGGLMDQVVGTAMLLFVVAALGDRRNLAPPANLAPFFVGSTVVGIGIALGFNAGYAINPARDFGPRLFTAMAGWGPGVFTAGNGWWWIPIVGPILGGIIGIFLYDVFVAALHPDEGTDEKLG